MKINNFQKKIILDAQAHRSELDPLSQQQLFHLEAQLSAYGVDWDVSVEDNKRINRLCSKLGDLPSKWKLKNRRNFENSASGATGYHTGMPPELKELLFEDHAKVMDDDGDIEDEE